MGLRNALAAASTCALLASFALGAVACSGATNQDLFEGNTAESDVNGTLPTPSPSASTSGTSGGTSGSGTTPAPTSTTPGSTPPTEPEPDACVTEKENNNSAANANDFKTCFKGQLANNNDVDWGSFTVPAGTKTTAWTHKETGGKVTYRFQMEGIPVDVGPGPDGELRLQAGATYVVRVGVQTGTGGNNAKSWELNLSFK